MISDEAGPTAIGKLFGISKGAITTYKNRKGEIRRLLPGRTRKLSDEEMQIAIEQIVSLFDQNDPPCSRQCFCPRFLMFQNADSYLCLRSNWSQSYHKLELFLE